MPNTGDANGTAERELQQAHQALDDAVKARDAGSSDAAVINRLYYAAFHAVQAVLYDRGFNPRSHGGVRSLFGSEIIAAGDASRENGRFLSRLSELRKQADYGYEELDELGVIDYDTSRRTVALQRSVAALTPFLDDGLHAPKTVRVDTTASDEPSIPLVDDVLSRLSLTSR